MNTNHWMEQQLNNEYQREMREVARREQAAQITNTETPAHPQRRRMLTKLRAEMSELASRWSQTQVVTEPQLQHQS